MSFRAALLLVMGCSVLLTRCALTDHYSLASSASTAGAAAGDASATSVGGGGMAGEGGAGLGGGTAIAGMSGSAANSGAGGISFVSAGGALDVGGSSGSAPIDPCNGACTAQETCCGSRCSNTTTNANDCGACGQACNAGRTCAASVCSVGWLKMSDPPAGFVARSRAAAVAMGKSVFIWGGQDAQDKPLDTGAIYSPEGDTWTSVVKGPGALSARSLATAVWTGSRVIVYGGLDVSGNTALKDAAAYDPVEQTWTALGSSLTRRTAALGFWDGNRAVVWGGTTPTGAAVAGADRLQGTVWTSSSSMGDPGALLGPALAFDGSTLYVQGGDLSNVRQDKVFAYSVGSDTWATLSNKGGLTARSSAFGAWDGSHFVVWGGHDDNSNVNLSLHSDGKYLSAGSWTAMSVTGAPSARMVSARRSGWAFAVRPSVVAIVGGVTTPNYTTGNLASNGALYDVTADTWKAVAGWPSGELHDYGVGVWTGDEFVIWGGREVLQSQSQKGALTSTGERIAF